MAIFGGSVPARAVAMPAGHEDAWVEQARQVGTAIFDYAADNNENYPDGQTSTDVFQKLIDGRYISDPAQFFIAMDGKTQAVSGQRLKPENVCFDVTSGIDIGAPDTVPLVYLTGYRITYKPGASALPVAKPPPPGIAVFYKSNSAKFLRPASDGSIANFIAPGFPAGKDYKQLTPDGAPLK